MTSRMLGVAAAAIGLWGCDGLEVITVSEYGGTPMAGINVRVNDLPWAVTDSRGVAAFPAAKPPYVVTVHQVVDTISAAGNPNRHDDILVLRDLVGGTAVIPVDGTPYDVTGLEDREAEVAVTVSGDQGQVLLAAAGWGTLFGA